MAQIMTVLNLESNNNNSKIDGGDEISKLNQNPTVIKFNVPVFDKSVDYVDKVREQMEVLQKVQSLHEDHAVDYLSMFKQVVRSQKRLKTKIAQNEERLLQRKREEKLSRKELQKMISLHPNPAAAPAANDGSAAMLNLHDVIGSLLPFDSTPNNNSVEEAAQKIPTESGIADVMSALAPTATAIIPPSL